MQYCISLKLFPSSLFSSAFLREKTAESFSREPPIYYTAYPYVGRSRGKQNPNPISHGGELHLPFRNGRGTAGARADRRCHHDLHESGLHKFAFFPSFLLLRLRWWGFQEGDSSTTPPLLFLEKGGRIGTPARRDAKGERKRGKGRRGGGILKDCC